MAAAKRGSLLALLLLLFLVFAIANLALHVETLRLESAPELPAGEGEVGAPLTPGPGTTFLIGTVTSVILVGALIALAVWSRPRPTRVPYQALLAILVAASVVIALAVLVNPSSEEPLQEEDGGTEPETPGTEEPAGDAPGSLPFLPELSGSLSVVLVVAALAAVYLLLLLGRLRWNRSATKPTEGTEEVERFRDEVADRLDRSIYRIRRGEDVNSVILECYGEMVASFRSRGLEAGSHLTAREFETLVRRRLGLSLQGARILRGLFEEARYSAHDLRPRDRSAAVASLERVQDELGV